MTQQKILERATLRTTSEAANNAEQIAGTSVAAKGSSPVGR